MKNSLTLSFQNISKIQKSQFKNYLYISNNLTIQLGTEFFRNSLKT